MRTEFVQQAANPEFSRSLCEGKMNQRMLFGTACLVCFEDLVQFQPWFIESRIQRERFLETALGRLGVSPEVKRTPPCTKALDATRLEPLKT